VSDGRIHRLPDGSAFFTATIGERPPGFIYWLKAHPNGSCRRWLYFWRNFRFAHTFCDATHGRLSLIDALRWAWLVS
jgi:hypothetical protein